MRTDPTRRDVLSLIAGAPLLLGAATLPSPPPLFRVRAITSGVTLQNGSDLQSVERALAFLTRARGALTDAGYEVQTVRVATQPLPRYLPEYTGATALRDIQALDRLTSEQQASFSIGPVLLADHASPAFAPWATELVGTTSNTSFSAFVASRAGGVHLQTARAAAEAISAIAESTPGGEGNFRFAATAFCPPGTPFFPAAYHEGERAFAIGLETPRLLTAAFTGARDFAAAQASLRTRLEEALRPIAALAERVARETGWRYLGIDTSPAPGLDAGIGEAIETLTGVPFGEPPTLAACAAITEVLKAVSVRTVGYNGLMLPVLEDRILARRAGEGRYTVSELLLYSSVCGTGLDVVPLAGDTSVDALTAAVTDVAALAARYEKPLSARLFPVPGKRVGEIVSFKNTYLTDCVVMALS